MSKKMPQLTGRPFAIIVGGALCAGLVGGVVSPAWSAEEPPGTGQSPVVGGFGLGDALEAFVEQRDGALTFQLDAGGLALSWDSRSAGVDRVGFGPGWGLGFARLTTEGGVRVHPTSGGSFEFDATHPSGLRGYGTHDVKFRAVAGQLVARDGSGEPVDYAYELHELGGTVTYFDETGDAVASVSATGLRTDWIFDDATPRRLMAVIDGDGVRTELDWESEPGSVVIRSGANLGAGTQKWGVRVSPSGLTVVDPVDQETQVTQDGTGLVTRLAGGSGATTEVSWHPADDGVPRVAEIRTVDDASSAELSVRRWSTTGGSPTGWPARDAAMDAPTAPYETTLTDGSTRVVAAYDAAHLLTGRRTETSTGSGTATVQELAFRYPEVPGIRPEQLPPNFNRPVETTLVHHDQAGEQRSVSEGLTFDDRGRMTRAVDGTEYAYDAVNRPMTEVTPAGATIASSYWADGSRKQRQTTAADGRTSTTGFYWDGASLINDTHTGEGAESGTAAYLLGAAREGRTTITADAADDGASASATDASYFTSDRHGNVVAMTDAAGAVTHRYGYTDYGVTTTSAFDGGGAALPPGDDACGLDRNPFQYAGEYTDCTGIQYLRARVYDSHTARFTRLDPTPLHSRYGFADANPITNIDPSGYITVADIVNYSIIGASVLFGAFSVGTAVLAAARGAGSLAFTGAAAAAAGKAATAASWLSAGGIVADGVGLVTSTVLVVNDHMADFGKESFLPTDIRERLTYLDYGLAGAGFVGALATAPLLAHAVSKRVADSSAARLKRHQLEAAAENFPQYFDFRGAAVVKLEDTDFWTWHKGNELVDSQTGLTAIGQSLTDEVYGRLKGLGHEWDANRRATIGGLTDAEWLNAKSVDFQEIELTLDGARKDLLTSIKRSGLSEHDKRQFTHQVHTSIPELSTTKFTVMNTFLGRSASPTSGAAVMKGDR